MMKRLAFLTTCLAFSTLSAGAHATGNLLLTSPLVESGQEAPRSMVGTADNCNGQNISPALDWSGAPAGTQSYAITLFDPDAPNGGWLHWAVLNIPVTPTTLGIDAGNPDGSKLPQGTTTLINSYKISGYSGPCPPLGQSHNYEFTVYAMPEAHTFYTTNIIGADTVKWLQQHALEAATLTIKYTR